MKPTIFSFIFLLIICSSRLFSQGIKVYEDFYESGRIYLRGYNIEIDSSERKEVGLWTYWYENGTKISEEIRNEPGLTKYITCWTAKGKQICINGNGMFYQKWTDFMADSSVYTIKDSIKQGHYISYVPFNKGYRKKAEGSFINGIRQGSVTYFYETGEILCIKTYLDNEENGLYTGYFKNGKIKEQGIKKEDRQDSIWSFYNNLGILQKKVTYKDYEVTHSADFYPNGIIKAEGDFTRVKAPPQKNKTSETDFRPKRTVSNFIIVKNGQWIYYNNKGKVIKKENYTKGKLIRNGM